jgi:hypothetical protein
MEVRLHPGTREDAATYDLIDFEAFKTLAGHHNFPWDFPSPEVAIGFLIYWWMPPFMLRLHPAGVACPELAEGLSTNGPPNPLVLSVAQRSRRAPREYLPPISISVVTIFLLLSESKIFDHFVSLGQSYVPIKRVSLDAELVDKTYLY